MFRPIIATQIIGARLSQIRNKDVFKNFFLILIFEKNIILLIQTSNTLIKTHIKLLKTLKDETTRRLI